MVYEIKDPNTEEVWSYHIDKRLISFLDKIKERITKKDKDYVLLIDGYEGAGKSTFAQQIARYVDNSLNLNRICMTAEVFKSAVINSGKGQCVIYDEAVTGLTSSDSISRVGKLLKSLMMQMRQKNLFIIVILPIIFDLNKYSVLSRARSFFHIYEKKDRMGYWVGYNRKDLRDLYLKGKKTHSYKVRSYFNGRFYGKYAVDEEKYRKKKEDALMSSDEDNNDEGKGRMYNERKIMMANYYYVLRELKKMTQEDIVKLFKSVKINITQEQLSRIYSDVRKRGLIIPYTL